MRIQYEVSAQLSDCSISEAGDCASEITTVCTAEYLQTGSPTELFIHWWAMTIFGSSATNDMRKIMEILTSRKIGEIKLIRRTYSALYHTDFLRLLSQKNNIFYRVAYLRASEPHELDAEIMRGALFGKSLDLDTLIEIVCTRPSLEFKSANQAYHARYNSTLERDVSSRVNGVMKEILLAVLNSSRYDGARVDSSMAMCDAKTLYEAIESGKTIDQKNILSVIGQRSSDQLKAILSSYKRLYGHEFMKFLKREKGREFGKQLRIVIRCIGFPEKYFVKQLQKTLKNGDAEEYLIRTVVTRAEIDIKNINTALSAKTGWSLESLIRSEFNNASSSNNDKANALVADFLIALVKNF